MRSIFGILRQMIRMIAWLVFFCGICISVLGIWDIFHAFSHIWTDEKGAAGLVAVGLLQAVDLWLIAMVLFVFSLGVLVLFTSGDETSLSFLPAWLKVKNFMQLKVILWEAILTTMLISYLAALAELKQAGGSLTVNALILPGAVLLLAVSLYFLKKGEH